MKLSISMTRRETLLGSVYLLFSIFLFPVLLGLINSMLPTPLSATELNLVFFAVSFVTVVTILRRFLWESLKIAIRSPWRCLRFAGVGMLLYYVGMLLVTQIILRISPDFSNVNDNNIMDLYGEHPALMSLCTIWLVPITEESLHRGVIFQSLRQKNRLLAYVVSSAFFSIIHVMGYVGQFDWLTLILCFIQYLPAGIALAVAYEKADTIVAPMLMHITINQIATSVLR